MRFAAGRTVLGVALEAIKRAFVGQNRAQIQRVHALLLANTLQVVVDKKIR